MRFHLRRSRAALVLVVALATATAACGGDEATSTSQPAPSAGAAPDRTLKISAIPDQDPAKLTQINRAMADYLAAALGVTVDYVPVSDYAASVSLFKTGDIDMVFFGGLTGVQARTQTPGSTLLAQRDIDDAFQSVFIANAGSGVNPVTGVSGLAAYKGKRFTFGAETSTSGRLMPEYFLDQAGLSSDKDFNGPPGYSGSHDKTVELVEAGSYDGGALNVQVWKRRIDAGTVDLAKVREVFVTPTYRDYHWMAGPQTNRRFGAGFTDKLTAALLALDYTDADQARLLDLYGAKRFIATEASYYAQIESIGRKLKLVT